MNQKIQSSISIFYEVDFLRELVVGDVILRITSFAIVNIVRFDLVVIKVGDSDVSIRHLGLCTQVAMWL
jgi:hypothetical protein